jgi:hypothetical protein
MADWRERLAAVSRGAAPDAVWATLVALADSRIDFAQTLRLDGALMKLCGGAPPPGLSTKPVRLALLGSSTLAHLHGPIRVAALRRGIWVRTYEAAYGQYRQELHDPGSGLHAFQPTTILIALDAHHLADGLDAGATATEADAMGEAMIENLRSCWRLAREKFRCAILQQCILPVFPPLLGNNEHRMAGSKSRLVDRANAALRQAADDILRVRNEKFPVTMKCAGSVFKNLLLKDLPPAVAEELPRSAVREGKVPAAWFLEQVGAKGFERGDIHVAAYHANLIYNGGAGTAADLCTVIDELKTRVRTRFGIELEEEVQYVG